MPETQLLYRAIAAGDGIPELNNEQEDTIISKSSQLSSRFIRDVIRHAGVRSLTLLVHAAQGCAYVLLNYLHGRQLKEGTSQLRSRIGKNLCGFMGFLRKDFADHFKHEDAMPMLLWVPIQERLQKAIRPGQECVLPNVDTALLQALDEELAEVCVDNAPSFRVSDYWELLIAKLESNASAGDNGTLRAIYTLITWNFNSGRFVQYVIDRYIVAIHEDEDALPQWKDNLQLLNRIAEIPQYVLHKGAASCKQMIVDMINSEIATCSFVQQSAMQMGPRKTIQLSLSVPQIGLLFRAMCDTGIVVSDNIKELTRLAVASFSSQRSGSISSQSLYDKFYRLDTASLSIVEAQLLQMLNQCRKYKKEAK